MPASTSSKIMQVRALRRAEATCTARLMRDSSPPEATFATGFGGSPGFALTRNSMRSAPVGLRVRCGVVLDCDLEAPAGHTELAHEAGYRGRKLAGGGAPCRRQLARGRRVAPANVRKTLVEPAQHEIGLFERRSSDRNSSSLAGSTGASTRCLRARSSSAATRRSTASCRAGVRIEPVEIGTQLRTGLAERNQRFLDERERRLDARIEGGCTSSRLVARAANAWASLPSPS
jgi:hypothetical protein